MQDQEKIDRLVANEVHCCLSGLVTALANGCGAVIQNDGEYISDLQDLTDQAAELAAPIPDYESFEFWAVSPRLADDLERYGEKVDRDFAGLCVWARTTTGQAISMDSVIQRIWADLQNI
jgi:hypothetical protein